MTRSQFINEAHLYLDDHLIDTLMEIDNPIATRLLDLHRKQQSTDIGFAMLGKKGKVNIINYKKAAETLRKKEDDVFIGDVAKEIEEDKPLADDWQIKSFNFLRDNKAMTPAKMSRLVNTLFPKEYEDAEGQKTLRDFTDKYSALTDDTMKFEIVRGEEIRKWYLEDNYERKKAGDLGGSCMRHDNCQEYFDIYTKNPDAVSMLICLGANGKLIGRALIWKLANSNEPKQLMDRIYFRDERVREKFVKYAEDNDMAYKAGRGLTYTIFRGERLKKSPIVQLDEWMFDQYPYMDTFAKLDTEDGRLYNDEEKQEGFYILTSTDGGFHETGLVWSNYEDREIEEDEAEWCDAMNDWISKSNAVYIPTGEGQGWWPKDHDNIVNIPDEGYFHVDDTVFSDAMNHYILYSDAIEIVGGIQKMDADTLDAYNDYVDRTKKLVLWKDMRCADWLGSLIEKEDWDEKPFILDDTDLQDDGKYILSDWTIKVYQTEKGQLSEDHCNALGIPTKGLKTSLTDEPSYYWGLKDEIKDEIISVLKGDVDREVKKLESWKH